jgi:hypothetical protein
MSKEMDFFEHVECEFAFLINEFGFKLTKHSRVNDCLSIEFHTSVVYVRILKSTPDFEPRFVLGRIGVDGLQGFGSFDWTDIAGLKCCSNWIWQQNDNEPFAGRVKQLARLLRDCGGEALRGNDAVFIEMLRYRDQLRKQHIEQEKCLMIRSNAGVAWEARDYKRVAALYGELNEHLSDFERKRLSFAKKQLQN